jgi:hypothetical protein
MPSVKAFSDSVPLVCAFCTAHADYLCDYVLILGQGKTCSALICSAHHVRVGSYIACRRDGRGRNTSITGTIDYCPDHAGTKGILAQPTGSCGVITSET